VSRPLAGTIRRGKTKEQDMCNEKKLLNDAKQCAEHIMLVDLGRNDVGKVCLFRPFPSIFYFSFHLLCKVCKNYCLPFKL
jgi:chorismate binding enzyme